MQPATSQCQTQLQCSLCDHQEGCQEDQDSHGKWLMAQRMAAIKHRVLVLSNKGGVGKSTIAANLAASLAARGLRVGLADVDLSGPSLPHMFGLKEARVKMGAEGIIPLSPLPNLQVVSLGFMLPDVDSPVMWRDSFKYEFLQQLLGGVEWGELDMLIIDLPPGTGGEMIGVVELIGKVDGAIVVTTPQEVALTDVRRGVAALQDSEVPILGIVENMAGLACPHCGGEIHPFSLGGGVTLAESLGVELLGRIPLDPAAMVLADAGQPVVVASSDSPIAVALRGVADQLCLGLKL